MTMVNVILNRTISCFVCNSRFYVAVNQPCSFFPKQRRFNPVICGPDLNCGYENFCLAQAAGFDMDADCCQAPQPSACPFMYVNISHIVVKLWNKGLLRPTTVAMIPYLLLTFSCYDLQIRTTDLWIQIVSLRESLHCPIGRIYRRSMHSGTTHLSRGRHCRVCRGTTESTQMWVW